MNRLIIIGNGFDLAHGIKTSYEDFILNYLKKACSKAFEDGIKRENETFNQLFYFIDELLEIRIGTRFNPNQLKEKFLQIESIVELNEFVKKFDIKIKYNYKLLENSINKLNDYRWVDLEIEYFSFLLATKNASKNINPLEEIKKVNNKLDTLKEKLVEYLKEQQSIFTNGFIKNNLVGCFTESIHPHEIVTTELETDEKPKNLFFLNFNYTNTFEVYFDSCRKIIPSEFDYIHGDLHGVHGQPIFGFGDELDKHYLEFEDEKNNELFKHIKSFEYLKNKNYYRLIRFIESGDYQVQIYGHSCGLSDRTMLNQIFEHECCKSIKIFYHERPDGTNDYTEKTYEISRHFKDKGMMRKKVVPFDYSKAMPQPKS